MAPRRRHARARADLPRLRRRERFFTTVAQTAVDYGRRPDMCIADSNPRAAVDHVTSTKPASPSRSCAWRSGSTRSSTPTIRTRSRAKRRLAPGAVWSGNPAICEKYAYHPWWSVWAPDMGARTHWRRGPRSWASRPQGTARAVCRSAAHDSPRPPDSVTLHQGGVTPWPSRTPDEGGPDRRVDRGSRCLRASRPGPAGAPACRRSSNGSLWRRRAPARVLATGQLVDTFQPAIGGGSQAGTATRRVSIAPS